MTGRSDDVLNTSGHRLGTAEIESALVEHPAVCEAAVVGLGASPTAQCVGGVCASVLCLPAICAKVTRLCSSVRRVFGVNGASMFVSLQLCTCPVLIMPVFVVFLFNLFW